MVRRVGNINKRYTPEHTHKVYLLEHTSNGEPGTRSQAMIAAQDNSRSAAIELNHLAQGNHPLQGTECRFSLLHSSSREEGGGGRGGLCSPHPPDWCARGPMFPSAYD